MFFGILVLLTALSISAVAIYYSVAGLVAIFAAAAIPVVIMGSVLEVSKLVTAVWLHWYWRETTWWLKTYLSTAVLVLMVLTSIGIFGFLSKAHIEQTATATQGLAQIERLDIEIARQQEIIQRANSRIESIQTQDSDRDQETQAQIDREQTRIDNAYSRIQPAIDEQNSIIKQEQDEIQERINLLQTDINRIDQELESLRSALAEQDIELAQGIVGVRVDGDLGPNTESAIEDFRDQRQTEKQKLITELEKVRQAPNTVISNARTEIQRLRSIAEKQISDSNDLINRLRNQIGQVDRDKIDQSVADQRVIISNANSSIETLSEEKFNLESEYRKLEAEVGPIKYIAEFIYGDAADKDLLEEAVRWVIIIIIFVFDPLAVLLLIASQHTFELQRKIQKKKILNEGHTQFANKVREQTKKAEEEYIEKKLSNRYYQTDKKENVIEQSPDWVVIAEEYKDETREQAYERKEKEFVNSKEAWKKDHPGETLKFYKNLFLQGKIDVLPWENYSSTDN